MHPKPYVTAQGIATCVLASGAVLAGAGLAVLLQGAVSLVVTSALVASYTHAVRRAGHSTAVGASLGARRAYLVHFMNRLVVLVVVWLVAWGVVGVAVIGSGSRIPQVILVPLAVAANAVYLSSLLDWYWVLPRVQGIVRPGLGESLGDPAWRTITRVWLVHRAFATLALSTCLAAIPALVGGTASGAERAAWFGAAGVVFGGVLPLNRRGVQAILNLPARLGDTFDVEGHRAVVVDVSLEGVRLRFVDHATSLTTDPEPGDVRLAFATLPAYQRLASVGDLASIQEAHTVPLPSHPARDSIDALVLAERERRELQETRDEVVAERSGVALAMLGVVGLAVATAQLVLELGGAIRTLVVAVPAAVASLALVGATVRLVGARALARNRGGVPSVAIPLRKLGLRVTRQRNAVRRATTESAEP